MPENSAICCGKRHALRYLVDQQRKEIETENYTTENIRLENEEYATEKIRSCGMHDSKDAQCLCQRMSLNNRTTIAGSRRVYRKACIRLSKCACGKTDRDAASLNKNYSKIPCGDSQTAQLSSHTHIVLLAPTAPNY